MPFFDFHQNNSGGSFGPPAINIIVEADTPEQANEIAESRAGIYFDGVDKGTDCPCCGDRWYTQWDDDKGTEQPTIYGKPVKEMFDDKDRMRWEYDSVPYAIVYYTDGRMENYG